MGTNTDYFRKYFENFYKNLYRSTAMRRSQAFPSKYIGKDDLKTTVTATIKDVSTAMIKGDGGDECKTVMFFKEDFKPLIINNCNWMTLEDAYGEESDDWHGKPVELYVDPNVMFGGKRVGGVRVRVPVTQQVAAQESFGTVDSLTFSQAVEACEAVGVGKDSLVQAIKAIGHEGYNAVRDTPLVRQIIENVKNRSASPVEAGATATEDDIVDIPF